MATLTSKLIVSLQDMVSGPARGVGASLDRLNRRASRMNGAMVGRASAFGGGMLRGALALGVGYVGVSKALGGTVGSAIKFEEAFADVRKVVDGTPAQLSAVRSEILALSKTLPVTAEGVASIYAAAGQSGIALSDLGKFAEMAAKVSVAWDTSQADTGEALAKIKTQLGMNIDELGLHADAINHLANNTASAAVDLVEFDKRVAATGKMFGFSDTQTLAFGASMISAGAESEVAATSFRNMGRALTKGAQATKMQRTAFSRLGLDAVKTSKKMQKDALGTTLDVLERIQRLPKEEQISIASALFGDEARALMPIIADTKELRRELQMVGTEANYSGSAFQEYLIRADTAGNALQILGNKFKAVGIDIGNGWLPTIKELGAGIGDVLDTLEKRVGVLDQVKAAFQGFMGGIGYGSSAGPRELMNDLGDLLFGKAFGGSLKDADDRVSGLARLSNRMREIGADLRQFGTDISAGNIGAAMASLGSAVSNMSGGMTVGGAIAIGAVGGALIMLGKGAAALAFSKAGQVFFMAMAAAALINAVKDASSLGEFVENLKGLSALEWAGVGVGLWGALKTIRRIRGLMAGPGGVEAPGGNGAAGGPSKPTPPKPTPPSPPGGGAGWLGWLKALGVMNLFGNAVQGLGDSRGDTFENQVANQKDSREKLQRLFGLDGPKESTGRAHSNVNDDGGRGAAMDDFLSGPVPTGGPRDVSLVGVPEVSIPSPVTTQPSGTQDVRVTNPQPAPIINLTINATTNASPAEIGAAAKAALSSELNALSRGAYSDGAN